MTSVQVSPVDTGTSPRSTVLAASDHMTTSGVAMNASNMAASGGLARNDAKVPSPATKEPAPNVPTPDTINPAASGDGKDTGDNLKGQDPAAETSSEQSSDYQRQNSLPGQPNPSASGYYLGYHGGAPPSPTVTARTVSVPPYDSAIGSFVQQQTATFAAAHTSPFAVPTTNAPLSPPRSTPNMVGGVPPASPLFPRVNSGGLEGSAGIGQQQPGAAPPSPSLPYMSTPIGSSGTMGYPPTYAATTARMGSQNSLSSDDGGWERNPNTYPSPQMGTQGVMYGVMGGRAAAGGRAYSVDSETMLPPAVLDPQQQDQANPAYSPYSAGHSSPAAGGTLFAHQQQWASYPNPLPDMYSAPGSPLQPRPHQSAHPAHHAQQMHMYATGPMRGGPMYGHPHHYYPASSPGPPIQTTNSNKGPDGANLFIFHIPNHFSNVDMYNLFCQYGNLLSVRIMVERDTGRSRGFGFVSYDNPESAAAAIKELNGYAIGNKRLKVQHKQIRQRDLNDRDGSQGGGGGAYGQQGNENYSRSSGEFTSPSPSSLPPSGPTPTGQTLWYDPSRTGERVPGTATASAAVTNSPEGIVVSADGGNVVVTEAADGVPTDLATPPPPPPPPGACDKSPPGTSPAVVAQQQPTAASASALANLGSLQAALPTTTASTAATSPQE